ncbi:MAG: GNAT family N-acetyltransferase [Candidatus Fibromonas sp.]|jgi:ribosomal protein S18 acetylase RimI-like enzyme|nr:GNAT family N-acetyltransferase [Candidatus Fibromonas sp.]
MRQIKRAIFEDLQKILNLQKLSFLSEAKLLNNFSIRPLTQTQEELESEFAKSIILKLEDESKEIIGSVRAYEEGGRVYVDKLIVHPDYQNRGIGTSLLNAIEMFFEDKVFELFTSSKSENNIRFYERSGYREFKREPAADGVELVFMEKSQKIPKRA